MAEDISELVVRVRPEGMGETQDGLADVSDSFEETADDVGESTGLLSNFADKFKGAGIVFAAAFGTMIGAIASKMPIISETATALDALLTAIGLRMDRLTRGPLSDMNTKIFDLADAISEPGRELEALKLALDIAIEGLKKTPAAMPFAALAKLVDHFVDVRGVAQSLLDFYTGAFLQTLQNINPFAGITNFLNHVAGDFEHFINTKIPAFKAALGGIKDFITTLGTRIKNAVISNIVNPIISQVNRAIAQLNRLPGVNVSNLDEISTSDITPNRAAETGRVPGPRRQTGVVVRGPALESGGQVIVMGTLDSETNLDSRKVAESTKSFQVKGALSRGRGVRFR